MKNNKTKKLIILALILLLVVGILMFLVCRFNTTTSNNDYESNSLLMQKLDGNQTNVIQESDDIRICPDIVLPGFSELTISANTNYTKLSSSLYNPESNIYYNCPKCNGLLEDAYCTHCDTKVDLDSATYNEYYLKFEMYLDENNELIYSSDLVSPGYHIENIRLNRRLPVGDYNAHLTIKPYYYDMKTECNNGELALTLHVTDTF